MRTFRNRGRREKFLNTIQSPGLTNTEGSQHHHTYKWSGESIIISCASKRGTYFKRTKESSCLQDCRVRKRAAAERQEFKELQYQTLKLAWSHLTLQKPTHPHLLSLRYPTPAINYPWFLYKKAFSIQHLESRHQGKNLQSCSKPEVTFRSHLLILFWELFFIFLLF